MSATDLAAGLVRYARRHRRTGTDRARPCSPCAPTHGARPSTYGWRVETDRGPWRCRAVVIATGCSGRPHVPSVAAALPAGIRQLDALHYRRPDDTGSGAVLVVGASASGTQIADELARSGRDVTIAVGEHVRLPRTYRGRRHLPVDDRARPCRRGVDHCRRPQPCPAGPVTAARRRARLRPERAAVRRRGRRRTARRRQRQSPPVRRIAGQRRDQRRSQAAAPARAHRRLRPGDRPRRRPGRSSTADHDRSPADRTLAVARFETIVWATGHRPSLPQLEDGLHDRRGNVVHDGGVLAAHVRAHLDRPIAA